MKLNNRKKIVVSSIATIFLVFLYVLIFTFSEQDGETSGGLSRMISEKCVEILNALSGKKWSEVVMQSMADYFENPIRKLAHFCEYAVMGALLFSIWYPWIGMKKKIAKIIIPWVFVSAAFDEIHQLFTPGRCGNIWDVLLDTTGGCFGLLCCILVAKRCQRKHLKKEEITNKKEKAKKL